MDLQVKEVFLFFASFVLVGMIRWEEKRGLRIQNGCCFFTVAVFLAHHTFFSPQIISPINSVGWREEIGM